MPKSKEENKKPKKSNKKDTKEKTIQIGEQVLWYGDRDKPAKGTLKWLGKIPEMTDNLVGGVQLDKPLGTSDGSWNRKEYFKCKPKHALFVDINGLLRVSEVGDVSSSDSDQETEDEEVNADTSEEEADDSEDDITVDTARDLESAINQGDAKRAATLAVRLAKMKIKCNISIGEQTKSTKPTKPAPKPKEPKNNIKLNITIEDDGRENDCEIRIPDTSSIWDLKGKVAEEARVEANRLELFSGDMKTKHKNEDILKHIDHKSKFIAVVKSKKVR